MQKIYTGILLGLLSCSQVFMVKPVRELVVEKPSPQKASVNLNQQEQAYEDALHKKFTDVNFYIYHEPSSSKQANPKVSAFTNQGSVLSIDQSAHTATLVKSISDQLKEKNFPPLNHFETSSLAAAINKAKGSSSSLDDGDDVNQVLKNIQAKRTGSKPIANEMFPKALQEAHSSSGFTNLVNSTRVGISHAVTAATKLFPAFQAKGLSADDEIRVNAERSETGARANVVIEQELIAKAAADVEAARVKAEAEQAEAAQKEEGIPEAVAIYNRYQAALKPHFQKFKESFLGLQESYRKLMLDGTPPALAYLKEAYEIDDLNEVVTTYSLFVREYRDILEMAQSTKDQNTIKQAQADLDEAQNSLTSAKDFQLDVETRIRNAEAQAERAKAGASASFGVTSTGTPTHQ